jgi:hypothetical protein
MREQLSGAAATDVWSAGGDECAGEKGQIVEKETYFYDLVIFVRHIELCD